MTHRNHDWVQPALLRLNGVYGVPWSKLEQESGIPQATLWDIADGKPIPRKWRRKLGAREFRDLLAMPKPELRWAIEHRERMEEMD